MKKLVGFFPGQGSQAVGMGKEFFDGSALGHALFEAADSALGFPLSKLCFEGPIETLTLTENAQPAILTVSVIAYRLSNLKLAAAAGHSLGEYSALVAAGVLPFEEAVLLVHKRGKYMQEAVAPGTGKMIAVMGKTESEIQQAIAETPQGIKEIANLNCPGQIVVAGDITGVDALSATLATTGAKVIPLNVSAPFHCSLMAPAAEKLTHDLDSISWNDPQFPVYANVTAQAVQSGTHARDLLKEQVCSTVRWTESVENILADITPSAAVEFGTGDVLSKLLKRIRKGTPSVGISSPESLAKALAEFAS